MVNFNLREDNEKLAKLWNYYNSNKRHWRLKAQIENKLRWITYHTGKYGYFEFDV